MVDDKIGQFPSSLSDSAILTQFVEEKGFVFVRDKPAIEIMQYKDYMFRKDFNRESDRAHCPFALAKKPIMTKKRGFVYPIGSKISLLFDAECVICVTIAYKTSFIKPFLFQIIEHGRAWSCQIFDWN